MFNRFFNLFLLSVIAVLMFNNYKASSLRTSLSPAPVNQVQINRKLNQLSVEDQNTENLRSRFTLKTIKLVKGCTAFDLNGSPGVFRFARHCDGDTLRSGVDSPQYVQSFGSSFALPKPRLGSGAILTVDKGQIVMVPVNVIGFRNNCAAEFDVTTPGDYVEQGNSGSALIQDGIVRGVLSYGASDLWPSRDGRKRSSMGGVVYKKCQLGLNLES
jgi:hypothetical protein